MSISATELKQNLNKYLLLAGTEDVYITQYGKVIAVLSNPTHKKIKALDNMEGFLKCSEIDENKIKIKRLTEKCGL